MGDQEPTGGPDAELERLYLEVLRGERALDDVADRSHRDAIRVALRLHGVSTLGPTPAQRARMRGRVLGSLRPRPPSFADRMVAAFTLLAAPAPMVVRSLVVVLVLVGLAGGAMVASADSLPDDALYGVKLVAEQVRLAVAITPEDKAIVFLSVAEHRLAEAAALAAEGREDDALVAGSEYAGSLASAAAELAAVSVDVPNGAALVKQLDARLAGQRVTAAAAAQRLGNDPRNAGSSAMLLTIASATPPPAADSNHAVRIATNAAAITDRLAAVAAVRAAREAGAPATSPAVGASSSAAVERAASATQAPPALAPSGATRSPDRTPDRSPDRTPSPTVRPSAAAPTSGTAATRDPQRTFSPAEYAALKAKLEAERAHQAADRAKQNAEHTSTPRPTRTPNPTPTRR